MWHHQGASNRTKHLVRLSLKQQCRHSLQELHELQDMHPSMHPSKDSRINFICLVHFHSILTLMWNLSEASTMAAQRVQLIDTARRTTTACCSAELHTQYGQMTALQVQLLVPCVPCTHIAHGLSNCTCTLGARASHQVLYNYMSGLDAKTSLPLSLQLNFSLCKDVMLS